MQGLGQKRQEDPDDEIRTLEERGGCTQMTYHSIAGVSSVAGGWMMDDGWMLRTRQQPATCEKTPTVGGRID
jgi:hypothetical protein